MRRTVSTMLFGVLVCCLMLSVQNVAAAAPSKSTPTAQINLQLTPAQQLTIELPAGLCPLDQKRSEVERIFITQFERHTAHIAKLLRVLTDCKSFILGGPNRTLNHWGGVAAALIDGKVRPLSGVSRSAVIDELARSFAQGQTAEQVRSMDELGKRILDGALAEAKSKVAASASHQQPLGLLSKDDVAAFSGTLMRETVDGKSRIVSGVWGATLVREYVVMVTVYRPFVDRSTLETLLSETRAALLSMILLNDKESFRAQ
jgi:hypothetical protein